MFWLCIGFPVYENICEKMRNFWEIELCSSIFSLLLWTLTIALKRWLLTLRTILHMIDSNYPNISLETPRISLETPRYSLKMVVYTSTPILQYLPRLQCDNKNHNINNIYSNVTFQEDSAMVTDQISFSL